MVENSLVFLLILVPHTAEYSDGLGLEQTAFQFPGLSSNQKIYKLICKICKLFCMFILTYRGIPKGLIQGGHHNTEYRQEKWQDMLIKDKADYKSIDAWGKRLWVDIYNRPSKTKRTS